MKVIDSRTRLLDQLGADRVFVFQETAAVWSSTLEAVRFAYEIVGEDVCEFCPRYGDSLNGKEGWYYLISASTAPRREFEMGVTGVRRHPILSTKPGPFSRCRSFALFIEVGAPGDAIKSVRFHC